jgi:tetratricopeptide (TPR) repeat protein
VTPDDDRKRRLLAWLLALVATSVLSMLFFCVMSRFRVFLTVPLLVFAGGGAATLVRAARERAAGGSPRSWAPIAAAFFLAVIPSILPLRTPHSALAFGHLQAGLSWLDQGNAARALPELQRSVDLEVSADAVLGLCRAVASLGRTEETVPLLQQAEIDFPTDPRFPDLLGVCLRALGRNREARDAYERALEIDPNFGQANFNLGTLFASEGNFRAGVSYFRRSALIDPSDAAAFHRLGRCYRALGLPDSAAAAFRRSLEVAPGYAPSVAELRSLSNQSSP